MKNNWEKFFGKLFLSLAIIAAISATSQAQAPAKGIDDGVMAKANAGDAQSQWLVGKAYDEGISVPLDYSQAAVWYRKAADNGLASAQLSLGVLYENGHGVEQDLVEGAKWIRKAADQGNTVAQYDLGTLYGLGRGVPKDRALEAEWYRKAAEQNDAHAQRLLGMAYFIGDGVPQDYAEAYFWLDLAAAGMKGPEQQATAKDRDGIAYKLTPAELSRVQERANQWFSAHGEKP
jgi:TPR repeat protein